MKTLGDFIPHASSPPTNSPAILCFGYIVVAEYGEDYYFFDYRVGTPIPNTDIDRILLGYLSDMLELCAQEDTQVLPQNRRLNENHPR